MKTINFLYEKKILLFLCIAFLLYGNTIKNGYGLDDQFVTENNYTNKGLKSLKRIFTSYYAENDGKNNYEYRPIVKVSYALEHQFFGVRPWVGHSINIILYGICLLLLYSVLIRIFYDYPEPFSFYIVFIFSLLPIHSEVVASLKNRDVLLCFIFAMLFLSKIDDFFKTNHYKYLLYAIIFLALGFLTKFDILPVTAIAPVVFYKKHKFSIKQSIALFISAPMAYLAFRTLKKELLDKSIGERIFLYSENPLLFENTIMNKLSTAFNSLGFYFKMLVFPSHMTCYYGYKTLDIFNFFSIYAVLGFILFITMTHYFFKLFKTNSPLWIAIVFFGFSISMYLNLVRAVSGIVADRYLFFSSIGFSVFAGFLIMKCINKNLYLKSLQQSSFNLKLFSLFLALICSLTIIARNSEWKNKLTLYENDVEKRPTSIALNLLFSKEVLNNLNNTVYFTNNEERRIYTEKAKQSLINVLKIDSLNLAALNNLAFIEQNSGDYNGAIRLYYKVLSVDSVKFEARFNLAYSLYMLGETQKAQDVILKVYDSEPDNQQILDLLAYILVANQNSKLGIQLFEKISLRSPENNSINMIIGNFYIALSDTLNAKKYYTKALENDKENQQLIQIVNRLSK